MDSVLPLIMLLTGQKKHYSPCWGAHLFIKLRMLVSESPAENVHGAGFRLSGLGSDFCKCVNQLVILSASIALSKSSKIAAVVTLANDINSKKCRTFSCVA